MVITIPTEILAVLIAAIISLIGAIVGQAFWLWQGMLQVKAQLAFAEKSSITRHENINRYFADGENRMHAMEKDIERHGRDLAAQEEHIESNDKRLDGHEKRIDRIEGSVFHGKGGLNHG